VLSQGPTKGPGPKARVVYIWQPIAQRMIEHWGISAPGDNIEPMTRNSQAKYGDIYNKITIASPDKGLLRSLTPGSMTTARELLCDQQSPLHKFCHQLIGDSTDNPGCWSRTSSC
jgi:hypothetical protein